MDSNELVQRIRAKMADYESEDQRELYRWIDTLEECEALRVLNEHFIIKRIIKNLSDRIVQLDKLLLEKRKVELWERENWLDRKEIYQALIYSFDSDKQLEEIKKQVAEL